MKRLLLALAFCLAVSPAFAAQQTISGGVGIVWGDEKTKINSNFTELYGQAATKWVAGTAYTADNQLVVHGGNVFVCTANHTAGSTTEPGVGASWATVWAYSGAALWEPIQTAASQAEMEAGTETAIRSMSPLRVAQAIAALGGSGSDELVYQANCATITDGFCVDTDDQKLYYYDGSSVVEVGTGTGSDELVYQADCSSITDGFCVDTDDQTLYYYDGSTVAEVAAAGTTDADAIHDNVSGEIAAITAKATPASGDYFIIEDSAASNAKKSLLLSALFSWMQSQNWTLPGTITMTGTVNLPAALTLPADSVDDTNVDWGTGAGQVSAADVPIADSGDIITATEVEAALQEIKTAVDLNTAKTTNATHTGDVTGATELTIATGVVDISHLGFSLSYDIVVESPTADDAFLFAKAPNAIIITDIHCIATGGTSVVIDVQECDSAGANCATVDATITCDTDGAEDDGTLSNGAIDAGDWIKLDIGTVTGEVSQVAVSIYY